ncbi:DMT family transporter [bacterium]|nr:DMT family transporter [bacterium]
MTDGLIGKLLALSCAILWAFAVILFRRSGETMKPLALNVFKSSIAGLVLLPIWYFYDSNMIPDTISMADLALLAVSGIIGITVADSLFFICLNTLGASLYAIIDCVYSPSMIFFSWFLLSESISVFHVVGACLVISGVVLATSERRTQTGLSAKKLFWGSLAGVSAILLMVISIIIVKPILDNHSAIMVVECRMIPAVLCLHVITLFQKNRKKIYKSFLSRDAFRLALPGALLGNVLSMIAWFAAFKYTDLGSASILNQTTVIFVVVLATVFLKEPLDRRRAFATVMGFGGSIIVLCA